MSGLEVIGGLASTAQLAAYLIKAITCLADIYARLKHAPERIEQHAHQIKRLIEISLYIKDTQSLQTTLVFAQLIHIIEQASALRDLLQKVLEQYTQTSFRRRYWKLLEGKEEKQILFALQNLEREKGVLTLCLTAAQNEALQDVRREIKRTKLDMSDKDLPKLPPEILGEQATCRDPQFLLSSPSTSPSTMQSATSLSPGSDTQSGADATTPGEGGDSVASNGQTREARSPTVNIGSIVSKKQAKQTNTFGNAAIVAKAAAKIQIKAVVAEDDSDQKNSFF